MGRDTERGVDASQRERDRERARAREREREREREKACRRQLEWLGSLPGEEDFTLVRVLLLLRLLPAEPGGHVSVVNINMKREGEGERVIHFPRRVLCLALASTTATRTT